ncbi:hypothetical protein HELRODRAFT_120046, partial [Helobdella robusta]|uniref:G-protein coupled receptors family 1 profile domain-containing protein n=1 Tax=Helobdella robusta TaxID=6412 RepID=T1EGP4_HELRO
DDDDDLNETNHIETIIVSIVYGLTFLAGSVGNSLVIICILKFKKMRSVTNVFLLSLASADLLLVFACVPIKLAKWFTFTWDLGVVLCKLVHYIQNVSVICSVLTLTTISIERYYAILRPMQSRFNCTHHRAKKMVCFVWLLSTILATPILYGQQSLRAVGEDGDLFWCVKMWPSKAVERFFEIWMLVLVLIIPLSVMIFAYVGICRELWNVMAMRGSMVAR